MLLKWLPLVFFVYLSQFCCSAQDRTAIVAEGGITGFILTEDGQPASRAKPCTSVRSGNETGITCQGSADNTGRFTIEHLKLGTYGVFAINEAEGYSIENQSPGQDVTVSSDQPWPSVTVRLHGRGGVLVGSITDKLTGRSIRGSIQYMAVDMDCDSAASTLVEGKFNVTITPNCDVVVIAKAKGYKGWVFTDGARPTLRLARGERKEINIQLEPSPTNSASE